jgi:predicted metalloprotease with PDZ domain
MFERKIAEWVGGMNYSKAATTESLEQLSIDESAFDLEKALTFYTKGPLVGLMLDIEIRTRTDDAKSLDKVMHDLYAESKKNIHFKDEELIGRIEKFSGVDLHEFYRRYIAGTDSLPLTSYLSKIGLVKDYKKTVETGVNLKTRFNPNEDLPIIDSFYQQSELEAAGLMIGDTILSFQGGKPASTMNLDEFSLNNNAPQKLTVNIGRRGIQFEKTITLTQSRSSRVVRKSIAPNENATPMEMKLRKEIYGG